MKALGWFVHPTNSVSQWGKNSDAIRTYDLYDTSQKPWVGILFKLEFLFSAFVPIEIRGNYVRTFCHCVAVWNTTTSVQSLSRPWVAVSARELLDFDKVNEFHVKHVEALQEPHIAQIVSLFFFYFEALPIHLSGFLLCNSCVLESALWVTVETQSVSVVFYDYIYVSSW